MCRSQFPAGPPRHGHRPQERPPGGSSLLVASIVVGRVLTARTTWLMLKDAERLRAADGTDIEVLHRSDGRVVVAPLGRRM